MNYRLPLLVSLLTIFLTIPTFAQTGKPVIQPEVWLKIDSDSSVSANKWLDYSGFGNDAVISGTVHTAKQNFNPSVHLKDGSYLEIHYNVDSLSDLTVFTVFHSHDSLESVVWSSKNTLSRNVQLTTLKALGPDSTLDTYGNKRNLPTTSTVFQRWDKGEELSENASLLVGKKPDGSATERGFTGLISEFILFDRVLNFLERVQVETYLSLKYGISKASGNYVNSFETVLWDRKRFEGFGNNIIGIGRDDGFSFLQHQTINSLDTSTFLTFGTTPLTGDTTSPAGINDGDFIVMGDNAGAFDLEVPDEQTGLPVLSRRWLVSVSGETASELETTLQLDLSQLPDSIEYWLAIDPGGNDFLTDDLKFILPDSIGKDSVAYFHSVNWDADFSGSDAFTLAMVQPLLAQVVDVKRPSCTEPGTGEASIRIVSGSAPYRYRVMRKKSNYDHFFTGGEYVTETGLDAGTYQLLITDANGVEYNRSFTIGVQEEIPFDLGEDRELTAQDTIHLNAYDFVPDSLNVTFEWKNNFGYSSEGPNAVVTESGIYTLYITNEEGCTFSDELVVSGSPFQKVAVYPSISTDGFYSVNVSLDQEDAVYINVFSMSGNLEAQMERSGQREYRFEGHLPGSGMYMISIETPEGVLTKKVIKQ